MKLYFLILCIFYLILPAEASFLSSWLPFVKKDCVFYHQKLLKKSELSQKQKQKLLTQAITCLNSKEFQTGLLMLEELLKRAKQKKRVLEAKFLEKTLADFFFYQVENYEKTLKYYKQLLARPLQPGENFLFQYQVAESFLRLGKSSQALREIEKCFFEGISEKERKKALLFKMRVLISQKDFLQTESLLKEKIQTFPQDRDFFREYLAFVYESQNKFLLAAEELKKIEKPSLFILNQIKRLEERQQNQPGF